MNVKWFSDHKQFIRDQCLEHSNVSKENEYTEELFLVKLHHRVNRGLHTWTDLYVLWRGDTLYETKEYAVSYLDVLNFDVRRQNLLEKWINMSLKIKISSPKWRECINRKSRHKTPSMNRSFWLYAKKSFSFWIK